MPQACQCRTEFRVVLLVGSPTIFHIHIYMVVLVLRIESCCVSKPNYLIDFSLCNIFYTIPLELVYQTSSIGERLIALPKLVKKSQTRLKQVLEFFVSKSIWRGPFFLISMSLNPELTGTQNLPRSGMSLLRVRVE